MFRTHLLFALFFYILTITIFQLNFSITLALVLCFGAIIPDIDSPKSFVNKKFLLGIGRTVAAFSDHRGFWHSIFGLLIFFTVALLITSFFHISIIYALVFTAGCFLHLLADSFTLSGVKWFWKASDFKSKGPVNTASVGENLFFGLLIFSMLLLIIGRPGFDGITAFISKIKQ